LFETFEYMSLARSLKRLNLPYAASIFHSTTFRSERDGLLRSAYKRSSSSAARRIAERMDTVYVHGERMRARLVEQLRLDSASRVRVLAHGAPHPASIRLPDRPAARKQLGIPETANVLLSLGTLRKDKELSLMVGAVAQTPGWMLLHAGPEGDVSYTELERLGETAGLGDRLVIHRRFIPAQDHALYFGSADLVAALYEPEMTHESGTAKRVRAFSRPLLASGPADLTDYVRDNGVGYTVEHPTPSAAALALAQHASKSTSEKLDLEARVRAVGEALSWSSVAASIVRDWQAASSRVP
jgi:glycosyltransferase involved in cell wall biosynthesis